MLLFRWTSVTAHAMDRRRCWCTCQLTQLLRLGFGTCNSAVHAQRECTAASVSPSQQAALLAARECLQNISPSTTRQLARLSRLRLF